SRIDHGRAESLQHGADQPRGVHGDEHREPDSDGLHDHAPGNQFFAAEAVREWPGRDLQDAPGQRVDGFDDADAGDAAAIAGEVEGIEPPRHAVVEIVDQAGLARGEQAHVPERRDVEDIAQGWTNGAGALSRRGCFEVSVGARFLHEQHRDYDAHDGDDDPEVERLRAQGAVGGDEAGDPRHRADREISGDLVQAQREAAPLGPYQIDYHSDRRRPRHRRVGASQYIGQMDAPPGRDANNWE